MARRKKKKQQPAPGWAWMLLGLSMGLAIALVVYLKADGPQLAESAATLVTTDERPRQSVPEQPATRPEPQAAASPAGTAQANTTDEGSSTAAELGFYNELGRLEVEVPDFETLARDNQEQYTEFVIQAGSFRTEEEADRQKARLALLGVESVIHPTIVDNSVWYRVIIGPLSERGEINGVRRRLRSENIDSMPPRPVSAETVGQ